MSYFFESEERQKKLKDVLGSWMRTPFRHWTGVKGKGCDCIHFALCVLEEFGFGPFKIPWYPRDWHLHRQDTRLLDGIRDQLRIEIGDLNFPSNGDLVLYRFGKSASHSAIYFDDHVYHAVDGIGVIRTSWMDGFWHRRKRVLVRILT
jgi:cell wall-associated NlpC family hydrolase